MTATASLNEALYRLQGLVRGVKRDSKNPHFRNSYASLEAVTDTIRPHTQECGLFWLQAPGAIKDGAIEVKTIIGHAASGEKLEFIMEMPMAKRDPQGAGSALTYAMRYSLMAAFGLPPTDDDAEVAIDRENHRPEPEKPIPSTKSSAQLKREKSWEQLSNDLAQDMVDVRSMVPFEKLKEEYRQKAREQGWPAAWLNSLKDEFLHYEKTIRANDTVSEIEDEFPGARVVDESVRNHPINAG